MDHRFELLATALFGLAVLHTFSIKKFQHLASQHPEGSLLENLFHLLGEVEIVFGLWAGVLVVAFALMGGGNLAVEFIEKQNFTEPAFVFVIMAMAATRPLIQLASRLVRFAAGLFPLKGSMAQFHIALVAGPLLGSFITEPAAMTVTALILKKQFFDRDVSERFKYLALAVLFVNVSIGGVLTHFAAPPVLMVAAKWSWDTPFMLSHFGWKAALAVYVNASLAALVLKEELYRLAPLPRDPAEPFIPSWVVAIHLIFLALVVATAHHPVFFLGLFLFFVGFTEITQEFQDELKVKDGLLVGFFLGGLVVLGSLQSWWLQPLVASLSELPLFLGAAGLTAVMDNAALTFLGTQVPTLTDSMKYALVAGAVAGGGLTVIANAPNPAGFAMLKDSFGPEGISPLRLLTSALIPTSIAMAAFWFL